MTKSALASAAVILLREIEAEDEHVEKIARALERQPRRRTYREAGESMRWSKVIMALKDR